MNKLITLIIIPLVLMLQPIGSMLGSLLIKPWKKSTDLRKQILVGFTLFVVAAIVMFTWYYHEKSCTIVTNQYHLHWNTFNYVPNEKSYFVYSLWAIIIMIPIFLYWDKSWLFMAALIVLPTFGFLYGFFFSDSKASLWCFYTSYTSIIAAAALAAKQLGFGDALNATFRLKS
jgi:hypothetical protein